MTHRELNISSKCGFRLSNLVYRRKDRGKHIASCKTLHKVWNRARLSWIYFLESILTQLSLNSTVYNTCSGAREKIIHVKFRDTVPFLRQDENFGFICKAGPPCTELRLIVSPMVSGLLSSSLLCCRNLDAINKLFNCYQYGNRHQKTDNMPTGSTGS